MRVSPASTLENARVHQAGFLLPLTIFILVVMSVFAVAISRNTLQTNLSAVQEVVSVQAFYAAESGAQRGMQVLFFPDASVRQQADSRCAALNTTYNFSVAGLNNCSSVVTCSCSYQDATICVAGTAANYSTTAPATKLMSFYKVSSVATCGSGNLRSVRTVEVAAFLKQE